MMRVWRTYLDLFTRMVELNNAHINELRQAQHDAAVQHDVELQRLANERKVKPRP